MSRWTSIESVRSVEPAFKRVLVSAVAIFMILNLAGPASASTWGAGTTKQAWRCLEVGDTNASGELIEYWSECTTQDQNWYVYIDPEIDDAASLLAASMRSSVTGDYAPVSDFSAINQTSLNDSTDTRVRKATIEGGFQYSIYTTCANNATIGGGDGYYQWCKRQTVLFDPGHAHAWKVLRYEDPATPGMKGRNFFACHELGHSTGLQHPGTLYGGRNTCMDYDGHWYLDAHERQHLTDCFPRPSTNPYDLTPLCRDYQVPCVTGGIGPDVPCE